MARTVEQLRDLYQDHSRDQVLHVLSQTEQERDMAESRVRALVGEMDGPGVPCEFTEGYCWNRDCRMKDACCARDMREQHSGRGGSDG